MCSPPSVSTARASRSMPVTSVPVRNVTRSSSQTLSSSSRSDAVEPEKKLVRCTRSYGANGSSPMTVSETRRASSFARSVSANLWATIPAPMTTTWVGLSWRMLPPGTGRVIPPYERSGTSAKGPWSRFTGCSPAAVSSSVATARTPGAQTNEPPPVTVTARSRTAKRRGVTDAQARPRSSIENALT